jgi:hypothetical protein
MKKLLFVLALAVAGCEEGVDYHDDLDSGVDGGGECPLVICLEETWACDGPVLYQCLNGRWEREAHCEDLGLECKQGGIGMAGCA